MYLCIHYHNMRQNNVFKQLFHNSTIMHKNKWIRTIIQSIGHKLRQLNILYTCGELKCQMKNYIMLNKICKLNFYCVINFVFDLHYLHIFPASIHIIVIRYIRVHIMYITTCTVFTYNCRK